MSRSDRVIGIALGLVVGVAALILFIFLGSEGSIDAPSIDAPPAQTQPEQGGGSR
jgi:hypothetical protein